MNHDRLLELLHYDPTTGLFTWLVDRRQMRAGDLAGSFNGQGYSHIQIDKRKYKVHRLAWFYMTGEWPEEHIDHINRDRADNRWDNLREATNGQNRSNSRLNQNNSSGFKGVSWMAEKERWCAYINKNGKRSFLGLFNSASEAAVARRLAARELHGEFARTD